jgi:hypothetical protein
MSHLVAHGDYTSITKCRTKILAIIRMIWNFLQDFKIFMYLFHNFSQNPTVLRDPGSETLSYQNSSESVSQIY